MLKCFFVETNHLKIKTMMIAMAFDTSLPLYLGGNMVTFPEFNSLTEQAMAFQTFGIEHLLSQRVTLRAIGNTLQMGMCF